MISHYPTLLWLVAAPVSSYSWLYLALTLLIGAGLFYLLVVRATKGENPTAGIAPADESLGFDDLAPVDEAEQSETYIKALKWALDNQRVQNIAVTGPYGSGKSSMLQTFMKRYRDDFHYLNISLASFKEEADVVEATSMQQNKVRGAVAGMGAGTDASASHQNGDVPEEEADNAADKKATTAGQRKNEAQQLIELSILQQIFYRVTDGEIPDSRFKRIQVLEESRQQLIVFTAFGSLLALIWLLLPEWFEKIPLMKGFSVWSPAWFVLIPFFMLVPGTIWLLFYLVRFVKDSGFKKLKISSGEIEINPKSEASILNKYLDELVYFFQVNPYNVVVIEDLDRFNDPEIFIKLRELNLLLNASRQVGKRVVFVYAVRDDLFPDDRTRTKFFDFILPVIPVINWSNSLEKLKAKLEKFGFDILPQFITAITLYIDDMRVLKNIFNELLLYSESLDIPPERQTKLLAMIVYKNIYPHDFAALHHDEGQVAGIFAAAQKSRLALIMAVEGKIAAKRKELKDLEYIEPASVKSLRATYIQAIIDQLPDFIYLLVEGKQAKYADLQEDAQFAALRTEKYLYYAKPTNSSTAIKFSFEALEKRVDPLMSYDEREALVRKKAEGAVAVLQEEVKELQQEKAAIAAYSVTKLINAGIDTFKIISEEHKPMRLLRYLLLDGFIDLSYPYLISYFYPGSIGRADMKFLTYVNDRIPLEMDYELEKPAGLIGMLARYDFGKEVILNIGLLDSLLMNELRYETELRLFLGQINGRQERALDFMELYVDKGGQLGPFIRLLCNIWPGFWLYVLNHLTVDQQDHYLSLIFRYGEAADINALNTDYELSRYINSRFLVLQRLSDEVSLDRMKELFASLQVSFSTISYDPNFTEFWELIYTGNFYQLTPGNVQTIISRDGAEQAELAELYHANYSVVARSGARPLKQYIAEDIDTYVSKVLLELEGRLSDKEPDLIDLYNKQTLAEELKYALAEVEAVTITDIAKIDDVSVREMLFGLKKVKPTWANVLSYFVLDNKTGPVLTGYLNDPEHARALGIAKLKISKTYAREVTMAMELAIVQENDLRIEAYRELIKAFRGGTKDFDLKALSDEKVKALIAAGYLAVDVENFDKVKKTYSPLHIDLLLTEPGEWLADVESFAIDLNDMTALISTTKLTLAQRLTLIDLIAADDLGGNPDLSNAVIRVLAAAKDIEVAEDLLAALIKHSNLPAEKAALFSGYVNTLSFVTIRELLTDMGGEYAKMNTKKYAKLPINPENQLIAEVLRARKFISKIRPDQDKGYLEIIPRKH